MIGHAGLIVRNLLMLTCYTIPNGYVSDNRDKFMTKRGKTPHAVRPLGIILLGLIDLVILVALLVRGTNITLFDPKGLMAGEQLNLMLVTVAIMMVIAVPTLFLFYYFAWKYRETNEKAVYDPRIRHGKYFVFTVWAVPCVFMVVLAAVMWPATHRLEPQKLIAANAKPVTIQVVAMRWKWLFIYPEEKIATVNFVQIPTGTPVQFELTADAAPMSSFWIPHLGGQLYAMTGHVNRLNLIADTPGDYTGSSAEINGAGFAGMKFITRATSSEVYESWTQDVRLNSSLLDSAVYEKLVSPSENNPAASYNLADPDLYDKVVMKYMGTHDHNTEQSTGHE
jgi:cytochrome o ubiquinol oxidase subunit 2